MFCYESNGHVQLYLVWLLFYFFCADAIADASELQSLSEILFSRAVCLRQWAMFYKMALMTAMMVIMVMLTMVKIRGGDVRGGK